MSKEGLQFYRCVLCGSVVSWWDIHNEPHACPKCGQKRIQVTELTLWEKFIQLWKHPAFWRWHELER